MIWLHKDLICLRTGIMRKMQGCIPLMKSQLEIPLRRYTGYALFVDMNGRRLPIIVLAWEAVVKYAEKEKQPKQGVQIQ